MAATTLKFLTVPAPSKHSATVIFVHGLGDTGHGWAPVAQMFSQNPRLSHIKWVLPHAPVRPVTFNRGMRMPSWFDVKALGLEVEEDEPGMLQTTRWLNELITTEVDAGIPANRIVLGGFSQGGTMSLLTGLTTERKLGGVVVLSGWLPLRNKIKGMVTDAGKTASIFWGHGKEDPMIKYERGQRSVQFLQTEIGIPPTEKGPGISFNSYDGLEHSSDPQELQDLQAWLASAIPQDS